MVEPYQLRYISTRRFENLIIIGQSMGVEISLLSSINSKHVKGCIGIDGGFYDLKKKYKNKKECLEALKPPDLNGINKVAGGLSLIAHNS